METNNQKTILIVEDDSMLSNSLQGACASAGYAVSVAHDGEEGLNMALANRPNVVLLDIMMPKMDGLEVLKNLNAQMGEAKPAIFMFTNLTDMDKIAAALSDGAAGYFIKAQTPLDDILAKIKEVLEKSPSPG